MDAERVLLEEPGVRVTTTRVTLGATTYPVAGLTSVQLVQEAASFAPVLVFGGLGLGGFGCSGLFGLLAAQPAPPDNPNGWLMIAGIAAGVAVLSVALFVAMVRALLEPPSFVVRLGTAGGDRRGYATRDRERAEEIRAAIEEAVTRRG